MMSQRQKEIRENTIALASWSEGSRTPCLSKSREQWPKGGTPNLGRATGGLGFGAPASQTVRKTIAATRPRPACAPSSSMFG